MVVDDKVSVKDMSREEIIHTKYRDFDGHMPTVDAPAYGGIVQPGGYRWITEDDGAKQDKQTERMFGPSLYERFIAYVRG